MLAGDQSSLYLNGNGSMGFIPLPTISMFGLIQRFSGHPHFFPLLAVCPPPLSPVGI